MRAKRSLGQNLLQDERSINEIVEALDLHPDETVIEIGPGRGALTASLLKRARDVLAVEFDRDMIAILNERFGGCGNFHLVNEDALSVDLTRLLTPVKSVRVKLVANLPYNISTPILQRLIESRHLFSTMVLMFQKEVVDRITAAPGVKQRGYLSVLVENAFDAERLFDVSPMAFHPVPKVRSSVVRLTPKPSSVTNDEAFRQLLSTAFMQKRKTLLNNLKSVSRNAATFIADSGVDGRRRAETLTLDEWINLTAAFGELKRPDAQDEHPAK
jgi:16S rRNA (adenine1518-N6/adenine1519-N6)-dimethyltransferase